MACLKTKKRSPYWWLKFRDENGGVREESTGLRRDLAEETRKARALKAQKTSEELSAKPSDRNARWELWVPNYITIRYAGKARTLDTYRTRWAVLVVFLGENQITAPSSLRRDHADQYMGWRAKGDKPKHVRGAHHNTARMELKLLSMIMNEAVLRDYARKNPLVHLGIRKIAAKEKPEISDAEFLIARTELAQRPEWMRIAFEIATYTGCRLSETNVILDDVDLLKGVLTFRDPKGGTGGNRDYSVPLRPELLERFERLKHQRPLRGQRAYDPLPPDGASKWWTPARAFHRFFKGTEGIEHLSFHCTRVSFVTRGARAGIHMAKMMRLVNHATELIHKIYQRLRVEDLREDALSIPLPAAR